MEKKNKKLENKEKEKKGMLFLKELILIAVFVFIIRGFLFGTIEVKGSSMQPNFQHGDFLAVNKLYGWFLEPKKGDVIVCKSSTGNSNENLIKRVIGMPEDEINIVLNEQSREIEYFVYINGEKIEEDYLLETMQQSGNMEYPFIVPEGSYFVMGDNRNASTDSRTKSVGAIEKKNVKGKVFFRIYPFSDFGVIQKK